jgi:hypothetical protein
VVEGTTGGKIVVASGSQGSRHVAVVVPPELCTCD